MSTAGVLEFCGMQMLFFQSFMWFKAVRKAKLQGPDRRLDMTMKLKSWRNHAPCWQGVEHLAKHYVERTYTSLTLYEEKKQERRRRTDKTGKVSVKSSRLFVTFFTSTRNTLVNLDVYIMTRWTDNYETTFPYSINPSSCFSLSGRTRICKHSTENSSAIPAANRKTRGTFFTNHSTLSTKCRLSPRSEGLMKPVIIISMLH